MEALHVRRLDGLSDGAREVLTPVAGLLGLPIDQIKVLVCIALSFVLAAIHRKIRGIRARHVFACTWGVVFGLFMFGHEALHSLASATITYFLMRFGKGGRAAHIAFVFNMLYVVVSHTYQLYVDYLVWEIDFTAPQMMLCLKLVSWAYNVADGRMNSKEYEAQILKERDTRIVRFPTLLEFYSYVYYFPSFITGPFFEYVDYIRFMDRSMFRKEKEPSVLVPALKKLWIACICCVGALLAPHVSTSYWGASEFLEHGFLVRCGHVYLALMCVRCKYYSGWLLAEAAQIVNGFGYNGRNAQGHARWDRLTNVDPWAFETAQNLRGVVDSWNQSTAYWLKNYVYMRTTLPGKKPPVWSLYATFLTSALWHGLYPGYFLFFLSMAMATTVAQQVRHRIRPLFLHRGTIVKLFYDGISLVATVATANYLAGGFEALSWEKSIRLWRSLYFFIHIGLLVVFVLSQFFPPRRKKVE